MTWLMAYALSDKMARELEKFCNKNKDVLISQINWQIWFLKNNGEVLVNLALFKVQDPDHFEFYAIEPLTIGSLPSKIKEVLVHILKKPGSDISVSDELKKAKVEYERKWS